MNMIESQTHSIYEIKIVVPQLVVCLSNLHGIENMSPCSTYLAVTECQIGRCHENNLFEIF